MKKGIHPEYHEINVTTTDGKTVKMYSSVKKDLVLSTDNLKNSKANLLALISNLNRKAPLWIC